MSNEGMPELSSQEADEALKEMHMKGRAMRIDETYEQYKTEREESWQKMQEKKKNESSQGSLLESLKQANNGFDDKKAHAVLDVTKEWLKYGGNLYDHITGKNVRLEKGIDYGALPDGTPDMDSYKKARTEKIEKWMQEHGNQKWLADGRAFEQQHSGEISYGRETVRMNVGGHLSEKERFTTPYFYENNWLYYDSNYFDKATNSMTQPERESTANRVYFTVAGSDVLSTYKDVIDLLGQDEDLKKFGFQIKTADVSKLSDSEKGQIMNQRDRIILYLGEKGVEKALPLLQKYAEEKREVFQKEGVLMAQPFLDRRGNEIPGITITSAAKGESPDPSEFNKRYETFNDMQSKIIESTYRYVTNALKDEKILEAFGANHPNLKAELEQIPKTSPPEVYLRVLLADQEGEDVLMRNLKRIYPYWAKQFGVLDNNTAFKK